MGRPSWEGTEIFTVGHSTRSLDELVELLRSFGVAVLADVRSIPRSRHNPQFNRDSLPAPLASAGIAYHHMSRLGGLRRPSKESCNSGWHNPSFRGFADYMATDPFQLGLAELRILRDQGQVAIMCAEAVPWRCHRSLIADAIVARGGTALHISGRGHASSHRLTPFALVRDGNVSYPGTGAE